MEKYIGPNNWKWSQYKKTELDTIQPTIVNESNVWLDEVQEHRTNFLKINILENGKKIVTGSLIYQQNFDVEQDYKIFHFYVTTDEMIMVDLDLDALKHVNTDLLLRKIERTDNAVDGFLLFLGELMNEMLFQIDHFEDALKTLIWSVRKRNETSILEKIYKQRHELLLWKSLLIPIKELKMGIEEVSLNEVSKAEIFHCTCLRIERALELLNEYEHELDSIIKLEEVISSHRGNEIMKTLTVITIIFTPIMAYGSLWGMNFKHMPELNWKFGYPMAAIMIVISTLLLYGFLKVKGWTGDLLKGKKKGSFFK